jgi:hypothetical protein
MVPSRHPGKGDRVNALIMRVGPLFAHPVRREVGLAGESSVSDAEMRDFAANLIAQRRDATRMAWVVY